MPISQRDKQELEQLYSDYSKFGGVKEDYFALLYLSKKFKCRPDEIAEQVAFGGNDYGVDAYYLDRHSFNLYLFQFKWSEDHNLFKESMDRLTKDGMERLFGNSMADSKKNEFLNRLKGDLSEKPKVERVFIHMVFMGDSEKALNSKGLDCRRETLENKRHLVQTSFGNDTEFRVEFLSHFRPPPPPPVADFGRIAFAQNAVICSADGKRMYVGFVPLMDLYRIWTALGRRFLSRNVRFGLSHDNEPNRKIREALTDVSIKGTLSPEVFPFNHNGVALAAEKVSLEDGHAVLMVPRLLNGAQTITSVAKFMEDNGEHPALKANIDRLEKIQVMAKIVEDDPSGEFVTMVTICNNRQNPIEPWNLRANDRIQCDLEDKFREEAKIFYSRQENAFENLSEDELESIGVDSSRDVRIKPLAQTFLSVQGEIGRMSKLPDVFEVQKQYEETFRPSYLSGDIRKMVFAYKVHLALNSPLYTLEETIAQKWITPVKRGRNLIWALIIQGILNDPKLHELLDSYAEDLSVQLGFREYLRKLATTKVKKVLFYILGHKDYADRLEREKYDFLRSKETFQRCMDYAHKEYGWTKRTF